MLLEPSGQEEPAVYCLSQHPIFQVPEAVVYPFYEHPGAEVASQPVPTMQQVVLTCGKLVAPRSRCSLKPCRHSCHQLKAGIITDPERLISGESVLIRLIFSPRLSCRSSRSARSANGGGGACAAVAAASRGWAPAWPPVGLDARTAVATRRASRPAAVTLDRVLLTGIADIDLCGHEVQRFCTTTASMQSRKPS